MDEMEYVTDIGIALKKVYDNIKKERNYCCLKMQEEEWFFQMSAAEDSIMLCEDYSVHYMSDVKYCPWCGKELKIDGE